MVVGAGQVTNREEDPAAAPDPFELMAAGHAPWLVGRAPGKRRAAGRPHPLLDGPLPVAAPRRPRPGAGPPPGRCSSAETRCSGMGGNDPPVARQPGRRSGGRRRPAPRPHHRGRGPGHPAPGQEAGRGARLALVRGLARHLAPPRARRGHSPGGEAPTGWRRPPPCTRWWSRPWPTRRATTPPAQRRAMGTLMDALQRRGRRQPRVLVPHAPRRRPRSPRSPPTTAWSASPIPKYLNAVMDVDMGGGRHRHRRGHGPDWGLGPDEVAYLGGWADAHDIWYLSAAAPGPPVARAWSSAPASALARRRPRRSTTCGAFDLYACFPSSIEVARDSFGIARRRPPTPHPHRRPPVPRGPGQQLRDPLPWPTPWTGCGPDTVTRPSSTATATS